MTSADYETKGTAELQTANVAYFQRKIQLSGFPAYSFASPSQLIRIIGVLLYNNEIYNICIFYGQTF